MIELARRANRWAIGLLARRYIAGPNLPDAMTAIRRAAEAGFGASLAYWNEIGEPPQSVRNRYAECVAAASQDAASDVYVSVKLPALGVEAHLIDEVLQLASTTSTRLHFDSLGAEQADATFEVILAALSAGSYAVGCTLPGRWPRSDRDAEALAGTRAFVRIVRGEWASTDDRDPFDGCLEVVERLAGSARHVSIATHDPRLAAMALDRLLSAGTPCDLETLYGRPMRAAVQVARQRHVGVRLYIPFGTAYLDYAAQYARAHPWRVLAWLARDIASGRTSAA